MAKRKTAAARLVTLPQTNTEIRIDLGCGKNKKPGFLGVDVRPFEGVDVVCNLGRDRWPWEDDEITEAHASHVVEHFDATERVHFVNELWRVLKPGGTCQIITPHWASMRAYGDLTHKWPPVSEFWYFYLNKEWRAVNAPHNDDYKCDFQATWGLNMHPALTVRGDDYKRFALENYKEAATDTFATLTKPPTKKE